MTQAKSPQLEDGHLRIANELNDVIWLKPFNHRQHKVVFAIIRKTYGYGKKEDDMSASQIGSLCGLSRTHVTSTLNQLEKMKVISKRPGVYGSIVGINKDYSRWLFASTKSVQVIQNGTSTESVQGVPNHSFTSTESVRVDSTKSVHTKDNLSKDNKQKTCAPADAFARFWIAYPKKRSKGQAEKAFKKINPNEHLLDVMLASVEQAKTSDEWIKNEGQFIKHPATWLNAKGWEDELSVDKSDWWTVGGFSSAFEAENEGYTRHNIGEPA